MRRLYHLPLSAKSRTVRFALAEKDLRADLVTENTWERRRAFLALNPAGEVPVLIDDGEDPPVESASKPADSQQGLPLGDEEAAADRAAVDAEEGRQDGDQKKPITIVDTQAICEYLDEAYPGPSLLTRDLATRAEVRRLFAWFDRKFEAEVTSLLVHEKVMKRFMGLGHPDSQMIRAGLQNMTYHLDYIGYLTERRNWLAGDDFSLADIAAAAHISTIDYIGDMPWHSCSGAKEWYQRVKSRKAFRPILADYVTGMPPPRQYADPDFD